MLFGKYTIKARFNEPAILPPFKGSTLRGGFGAALKTVMCGSLKKNCQDCALFQRCLYAKTFEPKSDVSHDSKSSSLLHPYVIEPPLDEKTEYACSDDLDFGLLLFGKANDFLPFFFHAVSVMGRRGLGKGPGGGAAFSIISILNENDRSVFDPDTGRMTVETNPQALSVVPDQSHGTGTLSVDFLTPIRLKYMNQLHAKLDFHILARAVLRRISSLFEYYGDGEPDLDYRGLVTMARQSETVESDLKWIGWDRYSNRQQARIRLGGLIGSAKYAGVPSQFEQLFSISKAVHLGKQTTFGLGLVDYEWIPEN